MWIILFKKFPDYSYTYWTLKKENHSWKCVHWDKIVFANIAVRDYIIILYIHLSHSVGFEQ